MTVETATKISQLNAAWPAGTDPKSEGDNHLRLVKSCLQSVFDDSGTTLKTTLPIQSNGAVLATTAQRGFIYGLQLANNGSDAANGIDIAPGSAAADDAVPYVMTLAVALTKKVNTAWAVGNGNGGLDTGTVSATANYHVWLIQRSDTGVVDALFSLSPTAPTMPASYDRKRRLGLVIRNASAIVPFRQFNRRVMLGTASIIRNSTAAQANTLLQFVGTNGIRVRPIIFSNLIAASGANSVTASYGDGDLANAGAMHVGSGNQDVAVFDGVWVTDASGNLRYAAAVSGTINTNTVSLLGWYDDVQ